MPEHPDWHRAAREGQSVGAVEAFEKFRRLIHEQCAERTGIRNKIDLHHPPLNLWRGQCGQHGRVVPMQGKCPKCAGFVAEVNDRGLVENFLAMMRFRRKRVQRILARVVQSTTSVGSDASHVPMPR